jgi:DNA mismatch endonuclease (patch repair protein)
MADDMTAGQRSYTMSRIRSAGNAATELRFVKQLRAAHISGWRRGIRLFGKPDLVFRRERVAVFLDGCFWHGCPRCYAPPKSNIEYWSIKIPGNIERDKRVTRKLRTNGWLVIRIWQHEIRKSPAKAVERVATLLAWRKAE